MCFGLWCPKRDPKPCLYAFPHTFNRYGILYFRIAIPADLRVRFRQAEVYRSLDTAKVIDAALSAQTVALSFKNLFRQVTSTRERTSLTALANRPPRQTLYINNKHDPLSWRVYHRRRT